MISLKTFGPLFRFTILSALLVLSFLVSPPLPVQAQPTDSFETSLHTTVSVAKNGDARINHQFTIKNNTPSYYITQYGLKVTSDKITNVRVTSGGRDVPSEVVTLPASPAQPNGQTSIGVTFPDKVLGEDKVREFTIGYSDPDAVVISGSVLEISLPPQNTEQTYRSYRVTIETPARYGTPNRANPTPTSVQSGSSVTTTFENVQNQGIFLVFGQEQFFGLKLHYMLENPTNSSGITEIALPPDTNYQRVLYHTLEPRPRELKRDFDGNWIATYKLDPGQTIGVLAEATAKLTLEPTAFIPFTPPDKELLKAREFWPVNGGRFEDIVQEHSTAEAINAYVTNTLTYNTNRALQKPDRLGADTALDQPDQAVCQEFTDTFVTLARTAGIPARRLTGYAYTQNEQLRPLSLVEDVLHAWPEYYDQTKERWVQIDPTWEKTTGGIDYFHQFDLNHVVFAINGYSSTQPYSAGSYKKSDEIKTVEVQFAESFTAPAFSVTTSLEPRMVLGVTFPGSYTLKLTNNTGFAFYDVPVTLHSPDALLLNQVEQTTLPVLLPFQTISLPLEFQAPTWFLPQATTLQLAVHDFTHNYTIQAGPRFFLEVQQPFFLIGLAIICTLGALGTGSVLVSRRARLRTLRRKSKSTQKSVTKLSSN